jgi:DNA-binding NtrC family response regulator
MVEATGCDQAYSLLSNGLDPDLLICEGSGLDSSAGQLGQLLNSAPAHRICVIAGIGDNELREQSIRLGVRHLLTKPVNRDDLESVIDASGRFNTDRRAGCVIASSREENADLEELDAHDKPSIPHDMPAVPYVEELGGNSFFLAASPLMLDIHRQVKLLADLDVNVLILGESGTGKEVIAQLIHRNSRRSREKFLKVNCAALPADLLESELFGHRQGAFTGAIKDRQGKFEQANRGTLLLDEIAEIGVQMQAKLLHVLQDGQFARLGAQETTRVDVRVLAATNIQIEEAMLDKTFREDLYYRLSVFTIKVPPLRERREEIPYLIEQIIRRAPAEMSKGFGANLPSRLMDVALQYDWRGNVRELRNFVTRAIVMRNPDAAARELEEKVAALAVAAPPACEPFDVSLPCAGIRSIVRDAKDRAEVQMIQNALDAFGWNRRRAAQYLNMSYRALLYKIQQHRLRPLPSADPRQLFPTRSTRHSAIK